MLAFFRICRYNLYCALRRRIEVVITGLTRNQVASRGLEGSNPSVSASATGNAFKRCLIFIPLRRRKRRARAPARARAARDWATTLLHSYTLCVPTIAERRIPPSRGVTGTVILSIAFFHLVAPAETEGLCEGSDYTQIKQRERVMVENSIFAQKNDSALLERCPWTPTPLKEAAPTRRGNYE